MSPSSLRERRLRPAFGLLLRPLRSLASCPFIIALLTRSNIRCAAQARSQLRLVEINQRAHDNLATIITALETEAPR